MVVSWLMKYYRRIFLVVPLVTLLFSFNFVSAEITRPYSADEKPQILFGDSVDIQVSTTTTYLGLENYGYKYVNGYLNITFTYTHAQGAYASYPPILYITGTDPRSVFINSPKSASIPLHLINQPTDWYLYDIQFDATGYTTIVKQAGVVEIFNQHELVTGLEGSDWTSLANHYPSQNPSTPHSVAMTPLPIRQLSGNSNVLFLPGFMGAELYKPALIKDRQLWDPTSNTDLDELKLLDQNDSRIDSGIYTKDIIDETTIGGFNIYKSFISMMDGLVTNGTIKDWEPYAYDWRDDILNIVYSGTPYENETVLLDNVLRDLAEGSDSGKVTIVTHSNGGLLAKILIKKLVDDKVAGRNYLIDRIDKIILVAVPQLGTPTAIPALLHGYKQDLSLGLILNKANARVFGERTPGAYGLLPSTEYFNVVSNPVITFTPNILDPYMTNDISMYGDDINTYSELRSFLVGFNGRPIPGFADVLKPLILSSNLLDNQQQVHNLIDNLVIPSHIEVTEVAGWGIDTLVGFKYTAVKPCQNPTDNACTGSYYIDQEPIFTIDGDSTVVVPSAQVINGADKYWFDLFRYNSDRILPIFNKEHKNILEAGPLLDFVSSKIRNINFSGSVYMSTIIPIDNKNRLRLSVHSPVTLEAYDVDGNHTGKICPPTIDICYAEENIPNSSYLEFGEGKYLNLTEEGFVKAVLKGTGIGTFTFESEKVFPGGTSTTTRFIDIPVTEFLIAEVMLNQNTGEVYMNIDADGDGVVDEILGYSGEPDEFEPIAFLESVKVAIDSFDTSSLRKLILKARIDGIIKSFSKDKTSVAKLQIKAFILTLEAEIKANNSKKHGLLSKILDKQGLSNEDIKILLDMFNELLDNLG